MSSGDSAGPLPLDAPWDEKEAAFEAMVRKALEKADLDLLAEEDVDDEVDDYLRSFDGMPGYEYLAQVAAHREAQDLREREAAYRAADAARAERMRGCADDPGF